MAITQLHTQRIQDPPQSYGMARQAIMNGNFDVWQRGTSAVETTLGYLADRWVHDLGLDGGTDPTITHSRQLLTSGDIPNAFYHYRIAVNGAGSGYGNSSFHDLGQKIEHGVRLLCGLNKTVTLSFWARTTISGTKRLGLSLLEFYGTGGSPSTSEIIKGGKITLTSSWTKYIVTFATNTLAGKTFGTNNDDYIYPLFFTQWGTTIGNSWIETSITAESFVGSGNIDIAQVQLCSGSEVLPFEPKSYSQELLDCQRYFWQVNDGISLPASANIAMCLANSATGANCLLNLPTSMRIVPTGMGITAASDWRLILPSTALYDCTSVLFEVATTTTVEFVVAVASGLVADKPYMFQSDATAGRIMTFSAEL